MGPIEIDGSMGEGGGQILRSALALALVTGRPFRIRNVRAGRSRPGLLRQHLTAVTAAAEIGQAAVEGAALGSRELHFEPGPVRPGEYRFSVGTAGSTTLVLQAVLPALLTARSSSEIVLEGGTHNPRAPSFDYLERVFLPILRRMGPRVEAVLERPGFHPAGGGRLRVEVEPAPRLERVDLVERGAVVGCRAVARVANLPESIARRELDTVRRLLDWQAAALRVERVPTALGPGNVLVLEIESERIVEQFTGFGRPGLAAERVAEGAAREAGSYLEAGAPVGPHLADQLLLPMALAGGGCFHTVRPTSHTLTNLEVLRTFLAVTTRVERVGDVVWRVELGNR